MAEGAGSEMEVWVLMAAGPSKAGGGGLLWGGAKQNGWGSIGAGLSNMGRVSPRAKAPRGVYGWGGRGSIGCVPQGRVPRGACPAHGGHVPTGAAVLQNGEILPLAALTYASLGVGLAGLLLAVLALGGLRGLRSNRHSIRRHGATALLLAQLVFLLGINQADLPVRDLGGRGQLGWGQRGRG